MKILKVLTTISVILITSCNPNNAKQEGHEAAQSTGGEKPGKVSLTPDLQLNNGMKWDVNPEMMVPMRAMQNEVNAFSTRMSTALLKDYVQLGATLESEINKVTSTCTMTGKAHEELHKWLLPYIELVKEMKNASKLEDAKMRFEQIRESLEAFNDYFK